MQFHLENGSNSRKLGMELRAYNKWFALNQVCRRQDFGYIGPLLCVYNFVAC